MRAKLKLENLSKWERVYWIIVLQKTLKQEYYGSAIDCVLCGVSRELLYLVAHEDCVCPFVFLLKDGCTNICSERKSNPKIYSFDVNVVRPILQEMINILAGGVHDV